MMPLWIVIILIGAAALLEIVCIVRALWYMKVTFPRKLRPHFLHKREQLRNPEPRVSLFVPCKGVSPDMKGNIHAMLQQDYPGYDMFCITESEHDPAAPILKDMASRNDRLHHVVAGRARRCCQKNHNLLKGIGYALKNGRAGDIYVFADMDIRPGKDWLSHITLPLADPSVFAVSGFRSLIPRNDRFSEHLHATFSALQAMAMTETTYAAMWGGSMALWRDAFDHYAVAEKWSTAMVDDMSLTWIIRRHHLKRVFSPDCLVHSQETYPELNRVMDWLVRQTQYAAIYLRPYTALGLAMNSVLALSMLMCPMVLGLVFLGEVSTRFGIYAVSIYLLTATAICLLSTFAQQKGIRFRWFLYAPCLILLGTLCGWIGFFSKRLRWANIRYRFNASGEVLTVEQMALSEKE